MKRLRFKKQKHLIAYWLKRLELRRKRKPEPLTSQERLEQDMMRARG